MIKFHLLDNTPYLDLPYHLIGWMGWFVLAALILWVLRKYWGLTRSKPFWIILLLLGTCSLFASVFVGIEIPLDQSLPLPNIPRELNPPVIMVFSAIPWVLAAGMLGVWPAALVGFLSGCVNALWNTHTVFTPLETASLAVLLSLALRQSYRTRFFSLLRKPLGAALAVTVISLPLFLVSTFFSTNGSLAARLDYSFTQSWIVMVINGMQLILAGLICEVIPVTRSGYWIKFKSFEPSPIEAGLQNRILYSGLPIILILIMTLSIADWVVAGNAASEMMRSQLESTATIAAENIPSILETGQSITLSIVDMPFLLEDREKVQELLKSKIREIPFFNQLFVFDLTGSPLIGYPADDIGQFRLSAEEQAGIQLALNGVLIQNYIIPPQPGDESAQIAFIASIPDEYGLSKGVVIARTNLGLNHFSQSTLQALTSINSAGGEGIILDENNRIIYHTNPNLIMSTYDGLVPERSAFYEETSATGTRQKVYAAVDSEKEWKVILSLPASYAQELALRIAIPLLVISITISLAAFLLLRYMMKSITRSLVKLSEKADEISKGGLENQFDVQGVDEIGRLGSAFEQMRISLKSRLKELDTLLNVSQGVAGSLDLSNAASHVLQAALSYGADAANLVLLQGNNSGWEDAYTVLREGELAETYAALDEILIEMIKDDAILIIPSKARIRRMGIPKDMDLPSALAVISLMEQDELAGILWIVYAQPHRFQESEIRFLNTLAGQAMLSVTNTNLYSRAEVGKQRLESVLSSTPQPVLVTSEAGELLIANQAALNIPGLINSWQDSSDQIGEISSEVLRDFLMKSEQDKQIQEELELENGKIYLVSVSSVDGSGKNLGKVSVLNDVTEYKELERMKSEFVSTVSHDLRAPMGLIRGYASMLQMVGELNDQQKEYSSKILEGIENITRMVDNLLDLGRIDSGLDLKVEKLTPSELLDQVIILLQPQANQRKVQMMRELTIAQELTIEADKGLLQQALYNLLENAIKFSPIGGQINLRLQVNEKIIVFIIQDHGPGIAPLDIPNIFSKIKYRGKKEGESTRSPGLGLSIVQSIADRHKGRAWVESTLGKGSIFYLEIPVRQENKKQTQSRG